MPGMNSTEILFIKELLEKLIQLEKENEELKKELKKEAD